MACGLLVVSGFDRDVVLLCRLRLLLIPRWHVIVYLEYIIRRRESSFG